LITTGKILLPGAGLQANDAPSIIAAGDFDITLTDWLISILIGGLITLKANWFSINQGNKNSFGK
jgi:hypothetical protein